MADPVKPDIDYSYTGFQQANQDGPFPGTFLDADLAELKRAADDTIDALADIRRADGKLNNRIVTKDSLGPDVVPIGEGMNPSTYDPNGAEADAFNQDNMADGAVNKNYTAAEQAKLAGITEGADVTNATNVAAAGAVMTSATDASSFGFGIDEDDMSSDSDKKFPTQQSVKAYADSKVVFTKPDADTTGAIDATAAFTSFGSLPMRYIPAGAYKLDSDVTFAAGDVFQITHPDAMFNEGDGLPFCDNYFPYIHREMFSPFVMHKTYGDEWAGFSNIMQMASVAEANLVRDGENDTGAVVAHFAIGRAKISGSAAWAQNISGQAESGGTSITSEMDVQAFADDALAYGLVLVSDGTHQAQNAVQIQTNAAGHEFKDGIVFNGAGVTGSIFKTDTETAAERGILLRGTYSTAQIDTPGLWVGPTNGGVDRVRLKEGTGSASVLATGTSTNIHLVFQPKGATGRVRLADSSANVIVDAGVNTLGFFGATPAAKQNITGALSSVTDTNAKTVLTSIISALSAMGLVTDDTT